MFPRSKRNNLVIEVLSYLETNFNLNRSDALDIISFATETPYSQLHLYYYSVFTPKQDFHCILEKLKQREPVAYITGRREFYGLEFTVTPDVLIPRVESERLVESVLDNTVESSGTILDLGTGSGCLLLSLLSYLEGYKGVGIDISYDAVKIARQNATNLGLYDKCSFICGDMTKINFFIKRKFDIIVCNPPYISYDDDYENSILSEPKQALFAHEKGLFFYKNLLSKLDKLCKRDGIIYFEIGQGQKKELENIYRGKNISFLKDLSGNYRIMMWKN